jgi:hypothetical protein
MERLSVQLALPVRSHLSKVTGENLKVVWGRVFILGEQERMGHHQCYDIQHNNTQHNYIQHNDINRVLPRGVKTSTRKPNRCLGRVLNFKLGCFV